MNDTRDSYGEYWQTVGQWEELENLPEIPPEIPIIDDKFPPF